MSVKSAPVIFLTGAPGVGKSTVGRMLADQFEKAFFLDLDVLRENVVKGIAHPSAGWSDETTVQFLLAHQAAGQIAQLYAAAGFAVVVAHCSSVEHFEHFHQECPSAKLVCLYADLETNIERNNSRTNKSFDPRDIEFFVHDLCPTMHLKFALADYNVLDTTSDTPELSIDRIRVLLELIPSGL